MTRDLWLEAREPIRERRALPLVAALDVLFFIGVALVFRREALNPSADMSMHAAIASAFDFADPHSITSRIAYPVWHIIVSAIFKLGVPLACSAAIVTAAFKTLTLLVAQRVLLAGKRGKAFAAALCASLLLMVVTGLRLPWFNPDVYRGVGSQNVWHNPTQVAVVAMAYLCLAYLTHCWRAFERRRALGEERVTLAWREMVLLAALLALTPLCKPTFMQSLLPAAFVVFLTKWLRDGKEWRYFMQIVLAFLPSVAIFLVQYLYYTGVLVQFTSGVSVYLTPETLWTAARSALMMCAFPLLALLCAWRKGERADIAVSLALAMLAFSALEAAAFHETGMRVGHGNFTWSIGSSAMWLWLIALRRFGDELRAAWSSRARLRVCGFGACAVLFAWHAYSGCYYLVYLLTTHNPF